MSQSNSNGILGAAPVLYASQPTSLLSAFSTMSLQDPTWNMDTGATSHLNSDARNLSTIFNKRLFPSIHVGDGNSIPVTNTGHSIIPSHHRPLHLHNVLVTPNIIKNLISVRQFTRDNNCTIEFDAFGFSVKDFLTRHILLRCDSSGDLYPVTKSSNLPVAFVSTSSSTWHQRLGHPGDEVLRSLTSRRFISCNKEKSSHVCHACQLGKHVKLPFHSSDSIAQQPPTSSPGIPSLIEPQPARTHSMDMRSQSGIVKRIERLSLHTSSLSPIPKSPFIALKDPNWCNSMYDEYNTLVKNDTWILVPRPSNVNLVQSMWLLKHKFHADGTLSHYKARLVANGNNQQHGVDFDETFSLVVKPATIRTVLSLAMSRQWPIHQLDVKNAFLKGYATRAGFSPSRCDSSLFIYTRVSQVAYLLIYVDDIIPTASSPILLQQIVDSLHKEFDMTDLGALNYFLGISVVRHPIGLFLSQKKYALQLLEHAHMVNCNLSWTPVDTDFKLDLSYAVQQICLYMHDPRKPHFAALKRILRYVQGTIEFGLHLYASITTSLVGYTDVDWAGCPSTRRSTFGYCVFLGDNLLS
ncbi:ribonuclease H-like domain-containing protein [Tanacetum coccineum]